MHIILLIHRLSANIQLRRGTALVYTVKSRLQAVFLVFFVGLSGPFHGESEDHGQADVWDEH